MDLENANTEQLIREVWKSVDPATKKALATKLAAKIFEVAEQDDLLIDAAHHLVGSITLELVVPGDIKDSIQSRIRESLPGAIDAEARKVVAEAAKQAAGEFMSRFNLRRY